MEFPSDWYSHILPGIIILLSLVPLMRFDQESRKKLLQFKGLDTTIFLGACGYVVGFAANAVIIHILKPISDYLHLLTELHAPDVGDYADLYMKGRGDLIALFQSSYQGMILYRSVFAAFILLSFTSCIGAIRKKNHRLRRWAFAILVLLSTIALWQHWLLFRSNHGKFVEQCYQEFNHHRDSISTVQQGIK